MVAIISSDNVQKTIQALESMTEESKPPTGDDAPKKGYVEAPKEAYAILKKLINDSEKNLFFLANFSIQILLNVKERKKSGRVVLGSCKVSSELERFTTGHDAFIILDRNFWYRRSDKREPLLYHECCHLFWTDDGVLSTVGHDFEEFHAVVKHYGDWQGDLKPIAEQLELLK